MRKTDALRALTALAPEAQRRFRVKTMALFGSVARDEASLSSDVDVLVSFDAPPDFDRFMELKFFLEDHLRARVDLVTTSALRPQPRAAVAQEAIRVT